MSLQSCHCQELFVDGIFKVVRAPFVQLFSVHAFIRQRDNLKQMSLAYYLISGKSTKEYEAIFTALPRLLSRRNLGVKSVILDFEAAAWVALRKVFHSVSFRSKKISNDQQLIQSDPISCPQNQNGNN